VLLERSTLTTAERMEKQKVMLHDTFALASLAGLVVVLSFATYLLFHSFNGHRAMLEQRWQKRGEIALAAGKPLVAIDDLHSALAYAQDDRNVQIELAKALAAAGKIQEAQAYFLTLLDAEPGSGTINLQLARLAVQQNIAQTAVDRYEAAIDGTWNGDAFARRRDIRLELARYLIGQKRLAEARNLLLITSGNGPDNLELQLTVAGYLVDAQDPVDALDVYRKAERGKRTRLRALEGAGMTSLAIGRFTDAQKLLSEATGDPQFAHESNALRAQIKQQQGAADEVLALYPGPKLKPAERAKRIAKAAALAQARLLACPAGASAPVAAPVPVTPQQAQLLTALAAHLRQLNPLKPKTDTVVPAGQGGDQQAGSQTTGTQATGSQASGTQATGTPTTAPAALPPQDALASLAARWTPIPTGSALEQQLRVDPDFAQNVLQLAFETERAAAAECGQPTGGDAALLRIANMPNPMEIQ
jgi:tetratricopeptide (TPR) repeat protein